MNIPESPTVPTPRRRTFVSVSAWTMPTLAVSAASPAFATSGDTLTLDPQTEILGVMGTSRSFTATVTGSGAVVDRPVLVTLPPGLAFGGDGPEAGQSSFAFATNSEGDVTFTVVDTDGTARDDTIYAVLQDAAGVSDQATISLVAFFGWGYNVASQGQITPSGNYQTSPFAMTDVPTRGVRSSGGAYGGLVWADTDGRLWARGYNLNNQLGVVGGTVTPMEALPVPTDPVPLDPTPLEGAVLQPTAVSGYAAAVAPQPCLLQDGTPVTNVVWVGQGTIQDASVVVTSDGTVYGAGNNEGQGMEATADYTNAAPYWQRIGRRLPLEAGEKVIRAQVSGYGTMAYLTDAGRVLTAGYAHTGLTAQGTTGYAHTHGAVARTSAEGNPPIAGAVSMSLGLEALAVVLDNGELWLSGRTPHHGGSGVAWLQQKTLPDGKSAESVHAAELTVYVTMTDGTVWVLGQNRWGNTGTGVNAHPRDVFAQVVLPAGSRVVQVVGTHDGAAFLLDSGDVYVTGHNGFGEWGNGTLGGSTQTPVKVPLPKSAQIIGSHFYDSVYAYL